MRSQPSQQPTKDESKRRFYGLVIEIGTALGLREGPVDMGRFLKLNRELEGLKAG